MSNKDFQVATKELAILVKKLSQEVPESSNAAEYGKFLTKTVEKARTFDKSSPTYVNYVAKSMKPVTSKVKEVAATVATPKRKADETKDVGKVSKKSKKDDTKESK